jgi:DNA-binding XRE family transcriptional regulator
MSKLQTITTPAGETLVVLPLAEYEALVCAAADAEEESADIAAYDEAKDALAKGAEGVLPVEVCKLIMGGDSRLKAIRKWRGMQQTDVAARAEIGQGYLSELENGKRAGAGETLAKLARVLDVPESWIS